MPNGELFFGPTGFSDKDALLRNVCTPSDFHHLAMVPATIQNACIAVGICWVALILRICDRAHRCETWAALWASVMALSNTESLVRSDHVASFEQ